MLPDYLIYDELKKRREKEELKREEQRPRLDVPRYIPLWPDEPEKEEPSEDRHDPDMLIIRM